VQTNQTFALVSGTATNTLTMTDVGAWPTNGARALSATWTNTSGWSSNGYAIRHDTVNEGSGTNFMIGTQFRYW
jgi:hypothetical protein